MDYTFPNITTPEIQRKAQEEARRDDERSNRFRYLKWQWGLWLWIPVTIS